MAAAKAPTVSFLARAGPVVARSPARAAASHRKKAAPVVLPALLERPRRPPPPVAVEPRGPPRAESGSGAGDVLRLMDALRVPVEADLYATLLKDCAAESDAGGARLVHDHIRRHAKFLLLDPAGTPLMNRLLLAYAAAGDSKSALDVLGGMPIPARDGVSWATVIAGLSAAGDHAAALGLFAEMLRHRGIAGPPLGALVLAAVLRGCGETRDYGLGRCVHGLVLKTGARCLGASLARFYALLGREVDARRLRAAVSSSPRRSRQGRRTPPRKE
ncbi:tetratricopeptide repeat (TPR)-like superfamily protein [Wolffia australiana]